VILALIVVVSSFCLSARSRDFHARKGPDTPPPQSLTKGKFCIIAGSTRGPACKNQLTDTLAQPAHHLGPAGNTLALSNARTTSKWPFCDANINAVTPSPPLMFTSALAASSARTTLQVAILRHANINAVKPASVFAFTLAPAARGALTRDKSPLSAESGDPQLAWCFVFGL
jgi:hypothetical protein